MEILKEIPKLKNKNCVSIGKFDGVHLGHVSLLEELVLNSELNDMESCVFTFDPYPEDFFSKKELLHLNTKGEIISEMEEIGVDRLIRAKFDEKLMNMSARDFVKNILVGKLNAAVIVCGSDVSFGKGGEGDASLLLKLSEEFGFETQIIDKIEYKGESISSSRIIKALEEGKVEDASEMLGYDYYHYGRVIKGKGLARQFDMPTVNINPVPGRVIPRHGVYCTIVETSDHEEYKAVTNVGIRPTVDDGDNINIESHLLDCPSDRDFYEERINVYFLRFLRDEKRFDSNESLFTQIRSDIIETERFFELK